MNVDFFEGHWAKGVVIAFVLGGYFFYTSEFGMIGDADATEQMRRHVHARSAISSRIDVVSAGNVARAHPSELEDIELIGCDMAFNRPYSSDGAHGTRNRQHASAGYECLFRAVGPGGQVLQVGALILKSAEPRAENDGYKTRFLEGSEILDVTERLRAP